MSNNKLNSEQNFTMNSQLKKVKQMTFHNAFNFDNMKDSKKQQFIIGDYLQKGDSLDQMFEDQGQQRRKSNELNLSIEQQFESKNNNSNEKQTNYKNTYINKINSLSKISSELHGLKTPRVPEKAVQKQHQLEEQIKRVKSVDTSLLHLNKHQEKQYKNRESARNSRTRKKIYIELLEKMTDQLDVEIGQLQNTLNERKNDHTQIQLSAQHVKLQNTIPINF